MSSFDLGDLLWDLAIGGAIAFVALGWLVRAIARWKGGRKAGRWPIADGIVHYYGGVSFADLWYSYRVNGSYYSGRFATKHFDFGKRNDLQGKPLRVRYHPRRSEISCLLASDQVDSALTALPAIQN